jgi:uncharacterized coiled-coil DUF342 family protein
MNNSPKRISSELISEKIKIIKDIDLNTLFNLNYNFDPLKGLIEHLLTNQEKLQNQIDEMCSKDSDREKQTKELVDDIKSIKETYATKNSFNPIFDVIKKINIKLNQYNDNFSESKFISKYL